jgi:nitroreductase
LSITVPPSPEFGEPLPITPAPEVLDFLARRRSASAMTLRSPGPSSEEITLLLRLAARVPDHGKLAPWRFIVVEGEAKDAVGEVLADIAAQRPDAVKATAALGKFNVPPLCIAVVSSTKLGDIPAWEQIMSAGAVCTTLLDAALAMGYGANWITDWYAFDTDAKQAFGLVDGEQVAGFVYIGTAAEAPLERVRPDVAELTTRL